ncbi:MAG: LuxR family transcriptional regulator, partial [Ramlibacter sp.]|nr:LuxR family transcriptional regulator [Ramlibacter sp.]
MENATSPEPAAPAADPCHGTLVGYDVAGFTRYVAAASERHGAQAGEFAASVLVRGEEAVAAALAADGFERIDATGDGAVFLARTPLAEARRGALMREVTEIYRTRTGLQARFACVDGAVAFHPLPVPLVEHTRFVWGPAIAELHATLATAKRPRGEPGAIAMDPVSNALAGHVAQRVFMFLRLLGASRWTELSLPQLDAALHSLAAWAGAAGAQLERLTHDEKGMHLRISAPGWTLLDRWTAHARSPIEALQQAGFDGACAAIAVGPVYRGAFDGRTVIVHGTAINRAAKACAKLAPGELSLDESVAGFAPRPQPPAARSLIGRQDLLAAASSWLGEAGPRALFVQGPPGAGKSALIEHVVPGWDTGGATIAATRCSPSRGFHAFSAATSLLRSALETSTRDAGEERSLLAAAMAAAGVDAAFTALAQPALRAPLPDAPALPDMTSGERLVATERVLCALLSGIARQAPLLLVVDDLHWCDAPSLGILQALLAGGAPACLAATLRAVDTPAIRRLQASSWAKTLDVPPLTSAETAELLSLLPAGAASLDVAKVHALSGGNPFHAIQAGLALAASAEAVIDNLDVALDARLDRLSDGEVDALRVLALHDRGAAWATVQAVLAREAPAGSRRPVDGDLRHRLIRGWLVRPGQDGDEVEIEHQLIRDALRRRMPVGVRVRLARSSAREIQAELRVHGAGARLPELAQLWLAADSAGRAAATYERAAGAEAGVGAYAAAADLYALALQAAPRSARALRWLSGQASAHWSLGHTEQANAAARQALSVAGRAGGPGRMLPDALTAAAVRVETGQFLGRLGEIIGGTVQTARFALRSDAAQLARGRTYASLAYVCALARLNPLARGLYRAGVAVGRREGNPLPSSYVLLSRAVWHLMHGRWAEGERDAHQARAQVAELREPQVQEVAETICGLAAHLQGDLDRALDHFARLMTRADARAHRMHAAWGRYASAQCLLAGGRIAPAKSLLAAAEELLTEVSDRQSQLICLGLRSRLELADGDVAAALQSAGAAEVLARALPPTNFSSVDGYSAAPLVGAVVALVGETEAERAAGDALAARGAMALRVYAAVFPIARPRHALVDALR